MEHVVSSWHPKEISYPITYTEWVALSTVDDSRPDHV